MINRLLAWNFISTWGALVSFVNNGAGLLLISYSIDCEADMIFKGEFVPSPCSSASIEVRAFLGNITEHNPALFGISQGAEVSFPVLQVIQEFMFGNLPNRKRDEE